MGSKAGISPTAMLAVHSGKGYKNLFEFKMNIRSPLLPCGWYSGNFRLNHLSRDFDPPQSNPDTIDTD